VKNSELMKLYLISILKRVHVLLNFELLSSFPQSFIEENISENISKYFNDPETECMSWCFGIGSYE